MPDKQTFFMIYAEGKTSPTKKYFDFDQAKSEAKRLCEVLGVECIVLAAIHSIELSKYTEHNFSELPF